MNNYPFDPEEICGQDSESPLWAAVLYLLAVVAFAFFGGHLLVWFIFNY